MHELSNTLRFIELGLMVPMRVPHAYGIRNEHMPVTIKGAVSPIEYGRLETALFQKEVRGVPIFVERVRMMDEDASMIATAIEREQELKTRQYPINIPRKNGTIFQATITFKSERDLQDYLEAHVHQHIKSELRFSIAGR